MDDLTRRMPQTIDLEESVLGAMLIDSEATGEALELLKSSDFYKEAHQHIFQSMYELFIHNQPIDIVTVTQELRKKSILKEVGGAHYMSYLTNRVANSANLRHYAHIVIEKSIKRNLIMRMADSIRDAYDDSSDVFDLVGSVQDEISLITDRVTKESTSLQDAALEFFKEVENMRQGDYSGQKTYLPIDEYLQGLKGGELYVLAARPAMGKTALALQIAKNVSLDVPVDFYSYEMAVSQLTERIVLSQCGMSGEELRSLKFQKKWNEQHQKRLLEAVESIQNNRLNIYQKWMSIDELTVRCKNNKKKHGTGLIVVDYLQLIPVRDVRGKNRTEQVSEVSRKLKQIAIETETPLLALCQLSRDVERRTNKRPMLSDLRESGAIEQDADKVMFMYRPAYYLIETRDDGSVLPKGLTEVLFEKNRGGSTGTIELIFEMNTQRFTDLNAGFIENNEPFFNCVQR